MIEGDREDGASVVVTIVDAAAVPWVNGRKVFDTMEPAFRDNFGGDADQVRELLSRYRMRSLWLDPGTTRRIDHVRADAGYADLSEAYHDSVEEAYFVGGRAELSAEGSLVGGDYFWRPPGWVHRAATDEGFDTILCMEGEVSSEDSGRVSRVVCGDHQAGSQARDGDPGVGPRGYVRRAESRFMPWGNLAGGLDAGAGTPAGDLPGKLLSHNTATGARSVLVRLSAGASVRLDPIGRERFLINTTGTVYADGVPLEACSLIHVPAGAPGPELSTAAGEDVELFAKICAVTA